MNPYSPPNDQSETRSAGIKVRDRNIMLEIVQAFATIIGIMAGWVVIGSSGMNETYGGILLGGIIIGLSCMIGLGIQVGRTSDRKRSS